MPEYGSTFPSQPLSPLPSPLSIAEAFSRFQWMNPVHRWLLHSGQASRSFLAWQHDSSNGPNCGKLELSSDWVGWVGRIVKLISSLKHPSYRPILLTSRTGPDSVPVCTLDMPTSGQSQHKSGTDLYLWNGPHPLLHKNWRRSQLNWDNWRVRSKHGLIFRTFSE